MDQILLCSNHIPCITSISNTFIRRYMLNANGSYVKVYLYLSMCIQSGHENLSISSLADMMENTEKDILRALRYWEKQGLLRLLKDEEHNTITGIAMINPDILPDTLPAQDGAAQDKTAQEETAQGELSLRKTTREETAREETVSAAENKISVTPEQTSRLSEDETFSWTCLIVESYLERPLKTSEIELLSYLYDTLNFSKELILYLYEYCCSLNKTNVKYVQTVALSWAEHNISTPEEAQESVANYNVSYTAVSKAFALGRPLAGIERQFVERWQNEWKMDLAVILEACNRTMLAIQKADFKYLDGILSNWHRDNVHTLQDIAGSDEKHYKKKTDAVRQQSADRKNTEYTKKNQFQSFQQRKTSQNEIDALEKILLTR